MPLEFTLLVSVIVIALLGLSWAGRLVSRGKRVTAHAPTNLSTFGRLNSRVPAAVLAVSLLLLPLPVPDSVAARTAQSFIVQASEAGLAARMVQKAGGTVTHELGIINAVGARLTPAQLHALQRTQGLTRIYPDAVVRLAGNMPDTDYPTVVEATLLHSAGTLGTGINVAVLDTGLFAPPDLSKGTDNRWRTLVKFDAITNLPVNDHNDQNGHGTHITGILLSAGQAQGRLYNGIAPNAGVISVKAFNDQGVGSYLDVIRGLDWIVANKTLHNIRVLNLSFSAPPQSYYWDDPLNQAVMRAWQAGIVVVAAAGNRGPDPMTIGVPGNVPYVITVGAFSDNYTPATRTDDVLASFSSTGPTVEGFVKPEVVAPGGHMLGKMPSYATLVQTYPQYYDSQTDMFTMSGTSQATAVVSGVVALMLQRTPSLAPDQVKCRLMDSARPAVNSDSTLAYSIFQQGAGQVNAYDAAYSTASGCANQGLNITLDLAGLQHYGGAARWNPESGQYYILGEDGYTWSGGYMWSGGYTWSSAYTWSGGYMWSNAYTWSGAYIWSSAYVWSEAYIWSSAVLDTLGWVGQQ